MSKSFQRGLVVGKFSPLHLGHELVIQQALSECEEVVLISYSKPEMPGCDAWRRKRWLSERFPQARCLVVTDERLKQWTLQPGRPLEIPANDENETVHRRFVGHLCLEVLGVMVDAVFTSEVYGDGFAAELTTFFRERYPQAKPVCHRLVDLDRLTNPVSGTQIRRDVHAHRAWLAPTVYASLVERVCFLGGESSGKSTLAEGLAQTYQTRFVPEYGRALWEARRGVLAWPDMLHIAKQQIAMEEAAALESRRYLFCDTSPLTTLFYSLSMFNRADPALGLLADRRYNHVFLCAPDFPFVQDGTRQESAFREEQHAWYLRELGLRNIPFHLLCGSLADRLKQVAGRLTQSE